MKCFKQNGLKLADDYLDFYSPEIKDIDFILGSEFIHKLPGTDITFGEANECLYTNTALGITLSESVQKMIKHSRYLKPNPNSICKMGTAQSFSATNDR